MKVRKILKSILIGSLCSIMILSNAYAMPYDTNNYTSVDESSELLPKTITNSA